MGEFIEINGVRREVVRVRSANQTHAGYYTTYRDQMQPGEEEYFEPVTGEVKAEPPVKHRRSRK
jgi:hypothetical protein